MRRILDRYVLGQWLRIFVLTALGFPLVSVILEATDKLTRLLDRDIGPATIALSYLYTFPEKMGQMIPAACLFATVFTIGPLSRHFELTAVKAGGVSFHRLIRPLVLASVLAVGLSFLVYEVATRASARALELQKEKLARSTTVRYNFVYRADGGWIYAIRLLDTEQSTMQHVVLERPGQGAEYPTLAVVADSARYTERSPAAWHLLSGSTHFLVDSTTVATFRFERMRMRQLSQRPRELLVEAKEPEEMDYRELGTYIENLRRSGNDVNKLTVERALKLAIPATCLVITLFGAPLAVTAPRAGPAVGVAISLGTTVVYLMLVNLMKAVGASGVVNPALAAWLPNIFFSGVALLLMIRVRT
jgi:lipopolysaccharide export system permease protein